MAKKLMVATSAAALMATSVMGITADSIEKYPSEKLFLDEHFDLIGAIAKTDEGSGQLKLTTINSGLESFDLESEKATAIVLKDKNSDAVVLQYKPTNFDENLALQAKKITFTPESDGGILVSATPVDDDSITATTQIVSDGETLKLIDMDGHTMKLTEPTSQSISIIACTKNFKPLNISIPAHEAKTATATA